MDTTDISLHPVWQFTYRGGSKVGAELCVNGLHHGETELVTLEEEGMLSLVLLPEGHWNMENEEWVADLKRCTEFVGRQTGMLSNNDGVSQML